MRIHIIYNNRKKISLFEIVLFVLTLLFQIKFIYAFSNNDIIDLVSNVFELISYMILIYIYIRRKFTYRQFSIYIILGIIFALGYISSSYAVWLRSFILVMAAKDVPYQRVFKPILYADLITIALGIVLYAMGLSDSGVMRRGYTSLGFTHANTLSPIIVSCVLIWYLYSSNITVFHYLITIGLAAFIYFVLNTRTATFILLVFPIIYALIKNRNNKILRILTTCSQLILFSLSWLLVYLFPRSSIVRIVLDPIFGYRIFQNYTSYMKYGIRLFGQKVTLTSNFTQVYNYFTKQLTPSHSITVDNMYITILITKGVIPSLIVLFGFFLIMKKAWRDLDYVMICVCVALTAYSFTESVTQEIYIFFPYLYLLCQNKYCTQFSYEQKSVY